MLWWAAGAVILAIAIYSFASPSTEQRAYSMLKEEGLTDIDIEMGNGRVVQFKARVSDTDCVVRGSQSASSEGWYLFNYIEEWYSTERMGGSSWPPAGITIAQVADEHPELCVQ